MKRNCWTCAHDLLDDGGTHQCCMLNAHGVFDWVVQHVVPDSPGVPPSMPPKDAPPCPGWGPSAEERGRRAAAIPGWGLRKGMVGWVDGQRCVILGPDDRPEELRHGPWAAMACSGEWEGHFDASADMARSIRTEEFTIDPDADASVGCLLAMLGPGGMVRHDPHRNGPIVYTACAQEPGRGDSSTAGRAITVMAESMGRWPGGAW